MLLPDRELVSVPARRTYQDMRRSRSHRAYSSSSTDSDGSAAMAEGAVEGEGEMGATDSSEDEAFRTFGFRGGIAAEEDKSLSLTHGPEKIG